MALLRKAFRAVNAGDGSDGQTCETVGQALAKLATMPVALPQNLTLVDPAGAVTAYVGPDIAMTMGTVIRELHPRHPHRHARLTGKDPVGTPAMRSCRDTRKNLEL